VRIVKEVAEARLRCDHITRTERGQNYDNMTKSIGQEVLKQYSTRMHVNAVSPFFVNVFELLQERIGVLSENSIAG
jgi:hypothetical protein